MNGQVDGYGACPFCGLDVALIALDRWKLSWHRTNEESLRCRQVQLIMINAAIGDPWTVDARRLR